jgi:hypothetical protein
MDCCEAASTNRRDQDTSAQSFLCLFRRSPERASRARSPILRIYCVTLIKTGLIGDVGYQTLIGLFA